MDALADGWAGSMDVIMVWVWMRWPMDGLVALTVILSPMYETPPPPNYKKHVGANSPEITLAL